jgi:ABC-type ATPase involved in cell division
MPAHRHRVPGFPPLDHLTVWENVALPLQVIGKKPAIARTLPTSAVGWSRDSMLILLERRVGKAAGAIRARRHRQA